MNFLYERCLGSFYYVHVTRKKLPKRRLYKNICTFNVDEIDTRLQSCFFYFQELRLEQEEMEESTNFQERPLDYYNSGGRSNCEYFYNSRKIH